MSTEDRTGRLSPINHDKELLPLRRAHDITYCRLYWIPVKGFPMAKGERVWLLEFLNRLAAVYEKEAGLRAETFLDVRPTINGPLTEVLADHREDLAPMLGWRRAPNAPMPATVSEKNLDDLKEGRRDFDYSDHMVDYAYWFLQKQGAQQREWLLGHGGLTTLLIEPSPPPDNGYPPIPRLRAFDEPGFKAPGTMQQAIDMGASLQDEFLEKSKELFAADYANDYQVRDLSFVIPKLGSKDFFSQSAEEQDKWFELFDVYIAESPADRGVVIASAFDTEEEMAALLSEMRDEGFVYPEA